MTETIEQRACKAELSSNEKIVLDFMLKNKKQACFLTSNEIAEMIGVSPSSVIRLSKKLGYENFTVFKKIFQREQANKNFDYPPLEIPYEKIKQYDNVTDCDLITEFRQNVLDNIKKDISHDTNSKFIESAALISTAKRIFIVGFRTCSGFASSFGVMLSCVRPGVFVISSHQPLVDSLIDLTDEDVMIAIAFKRYSSDTIFATEMAKDAGCKVIAMTDSYAAPIAQGAEKIIISSMDNLSFFNSYVSFIMNMETIIALVSKGNKELNESRLMRMEDYLERTGQY